MILARLLALLLLGASPPALAAEPAVATRAEITHLFSHLKASGCDFNRNGSWHGAVEAAQHLDKKYQYLLKKGLVASTEDFIARAATESSMSGKPYQVRCAGARPVNSADWFREELGRYRKQGA